MRLFLARNDSWRNAVLPGRSEVIALAVLPDGSTIHRGGDQAWLIRNKMRLTMTVPCAQTFSQRVGYPRRVDIVRHQLVHSNHPWVAYEYLYHLAGQIFLCLDNDGTALIAPSWMGRDVTQETYYQSCYAALNPQQQAARLAA